MHRNEDGRVVKATGLRSVGAIFVGSNPTPRNEFVVSLKNISMDYYKPTELDISVKKVFERS